MAGYQRFEYYITIVSKELEEEKDLNYYNLWQKQKEDLNENTYLIQSLGILSIKRLYFHTQKNLLIIPIL